MLPAKGEHKDVAHSAKLRLLGFRQKNGHWHVQGTCNPLNVADRDVSLTSFDRTDVVGVESGSLCNSFLGQFLVQANAPHVGCKQLLCSTLLSWVAHVGSFSDRHAQIHTL